MDQKGIASSRLGDKILGFIRPYDEGANQLIGSIGYSTVIMKCRGKFLLIYNRGRDQWEFPGGKVEAGEDPQACAIRELAEESGQVAEHFKLEAIVKTYFKNADKIVYGALYSAESSELLSFQGNPEVSRIKLWDPRSNEASVDEFGQALFNAVSHYVQPHNDSAGQSERDWFEKVPKVELHLHLEGAIPLDVMWQLVQKYGDPSIPNLRALERRFQYRDFPHFIETWIWHNRFLREYEDFTLIAEAVACDLARQNIRYVEAIYSPSDYFAHGLETRKLTEAIRSGFSRIKGIRISLVVDFCRNTGLTTADRILNEISEVKELGVIGVTIGGSEQSFPPEPYAEVYKKARNLGFHTSAHAGEAAGPESIWGAVRSLKVERIGHGTRAIEDERLLDYLAEKQIPLEVCPLSNVRTGVVKSIDSHPVRKFFERGLVITINTDDPKMFGNSLAEEYSLLVNRLGFSHKEIGHLILQGIHSSWLSDEEKRQLKAQFLADPGWHFKG